MNGSDNRHMDEQPYAALQRLRGRADPADHQLIDTLADQIDALEERTRCAEQECERLRYKVKAGQKRAEEALLKPVANERDKLRTLVDSIASEVWFLDADRNVVLLNPAVTRGLGFESEGDRPLNEVLGSLEILDPDGTPRPQEETPLYRSLRGEVVSGEETVRHLTTGELRYRRYKSSPVRDQAGSIIGAVAVVSDITEDKLGEEELRTSLDRLALALDAIEAGVSFWDLKTDRMQWNPRQFELLGYAPGTVEPGLAALVDRVHPDDRERVTAAIDRSIREREDFTMEYRVCLPNGDVRWVHSIRRFAYDAEGRAVSSHGIMYDITDHKHMKRSGSRHTTRSNIIWNSSPFWATMSATRSR